MYCTNSKRASGKSIDKDQRTSWSDSIKRFVLMGEINTVEPL